MEIQYGWLDGTQRSNTIGIYDGGSTATIDTDEIEDLITGLRRAACEYVKFLSQPTLPEGDTEEVTKPSADVIWTRENAPGFVGGEEIAQKASDDEMQMLIDLSNKIAEYDRQLLSLAKMRGNIIQAIREKG